MSDHDLPMSALLGALSLATDAANGVRPQTALRTAVLAVELATRAGLDPSVVRCAYWTALLRFLGCTSFAHETAALAAGDDLALLAALQTVDAASSRSVLSRALDATQSKGALDRFAALARLIATPTAGRELASSHCAQADSLAALLDAGADVRAALADLYERWDGRGNPAQKRAAELSLAARVVHVAAWAEAHDARGGPSSALSAVLAMAGRSLDPALADVFGKCGLELLESIERRAFERAIELEPAPQWVCGSAQREAVFIAFARYADLKSPFTLSHSTHVASLVERTARALGMTDDERTRTRHAALLHDLGRVAVSNGVWDARGTLGYVEREQIRSHALHTERVLCGFEATRALARVASAAHEREDESGYPHGRAPRSLSAKVLAACDVASALREERPHRAAMSMDATVQTLHDEARAGRLDATVVDAVIAVLRGRTLSVSSPSPLSDRERSVLALLARGQSNKDIAAALGISPKTVQHHVAHVYEKTGVRSRAAAALYAVEHGVLEPTA